MSRPLDGIRVLDFSRVLSGPYATMFLADMGADVVKIERPEVGDDTRTYGPPFSHGVSTYFLSINRGKRSVVLDFKNGEDRARATSLARHADVVVENFRPGVMERLGLGYEALSEHNPGLVWCAISGFGQVGGSRPGYDLVVQGLSGIPALTGTPEMEPTKCGASIADLVAGLNAVQGILAALFRRERTGKGGFVDVSMLDGQRSLLTYHASALLNAGIEPTRRGNQHPSIHPFRTFRASDGHINVAIGNDSLWRRFVEVLVGLDASHGAALATDTRFARNADRVRHRDALDAILEPIFAARGVSEWQVALQSAAIPCGPMATLRESLDDATIVRHPHPSADAEVQSLPLPFALDGLPRAAERRAPLLGEHTDEVLQEWLGEGAF